MNETQRTLIQWIDKSLQSMRRAPRMWGSWEAVELQNILLWEMKALALNPALISEHPGLVLKLYQSFTGGILRQETIPYFHPTLKEEEFQESDRRLVEHLQQAEKEIFGHISAGLPFQTEELVLHLTYKDPKATVNARDITSYYEEFVRTTRALARAVPTPGDGYGIGKGGSGRHRKELEEATRFTLEDVQIERPNGVPGGAWLMLGRQTEGEDPHAARQVRDALASVVQLAEWAASDEPELPKPYMGQPHVALQTLRLLPPKHVAQVELGGRFLARSKPVALSGGLEPKLLRVVEAHTRPTPFEHTGEIRAVDLDAGILFLGQNKRDRLRCYLPPELLGEITEVGVTARVEGSRYESKFGGAFVRASSLTLL